jgi:heme-degrading monooxygenase HmoA
MVLEHALLFVKPGAERPFEAAFTQAKEIIAGMAGFGRLTLSRCVEQLGT